MKKIYCFGNEFIKDDSLAKQIADEIRIKGFEFVKCNNFEDIEGDIILLDVVKGAKDAVLINDLDKINTENTSLISSHDFDLGNELKLRKAIGQLNKISIIGIPENGNKEEIIKKIKQIILSL